MPVHFVSLLATLLAVLLALSSFGLYMVAFFFPEVYRKGDLTWSGVVMVYAIALWLSADDLSVFLLLGQVAAIALLGRFGWQSLELRRAVAPDGEKTAFLGEEDSIAAVLWVKGRSLLRLLKTSLQQSVSND
ncbi:MAG: Ycf66 family protein [Leptolyngbyaceae cyanobacterium]